MENVQVSTEVYQPLCWMGQTLGFAIMAVALSVWRQVAMVAGTAIGAQTSWRAIIAAMAMQAGSRLLLGLSDQLDVFFPMEVSWKRPEEGPFMWVALALAAGSVGSLWPMWRNVAIKTMGKPNQAGAVAWLAMGCCLVGVLELPRSVWSFLDLCAMATLVSTGTGMLALSIGAKGIKIGQVRIVSSIGVLVGLGFGVASMRSGSDSAIWATAAALVGSMVLIAALHRRVREISKGRVKSSWRAGVFHGAMSWALLAMVGPTLWMVSSHPEGIYRDYMMGLGMLCALAWIGWHFRQLNLAVAHYIEQLGRDRGRALLMGVEAAAFLVDEKARVVDCSKGAEMLASTHSKMLAGRAVWEILGVEQGAKGAFARRDRWERDLVFAWTDLGDDHEGFSVITARDVTSENVAKSALDRAAREDELTGLPNRREALAIVDQILEAAGPREELGLLFMDLDHFKNVNDTEGHAAGDALLREVAGLLDESLREAGGWLARLGGDEFLGVIPGGGEAECEMAAARCIAAMDQSQRAAKWSVGVSVGVALHPKDGDTGLDLIRRADAAMYEAKTSGRGRVSFFGEAIEQRLRRRVQVESFVREALKVDIGLAMALQPLCAMDGRYMGQAEALIRAPGMPGLGAQELIMVAEQSGLIVQLGRWVLRQAVSIQREADARGVDLALSINVSAKQFMDELFWEQFRGMARLGHFPRGITLEVTETTLMEDHARAKRLLHEARALGANIALDDFGAGYSSLSTLKNMPLDKLKLDKSLLDDVPEEEEAKRVAQAAIAMAEALGLEVVAEGVEREDQACWLASRGVKWAQGYLFAKPMDPSTLMDLVLSGAHHFLGEPIEKTIDKI